MGVAASKKTAIRFIEKSGFFHRLQKKAPLLKPHHMKARLEFAKKMILKPIEYWNSVLWSDETCLYLSNNGGKNGYELMTKKNMINDSHNQL